MKTTRRILLPAIALLAIIGCTRGKNDSNSSSMTISLPDTKAYSAKAKGLSPQAVKEDAIYKAIRVNVTGAGITEPVLYKWDANDKTTGTPPSTISISVPQGTARTIAVLGVLKDSSGMVFQYGSTVMDLKSASVDVSISLAAIGGAATGEGRIMGQYLTGAATGPTDIVNIYFNPPGDLPPLLIEQSEMFNGYFSVFGLNNVNFTYKLGDGTILFKDVNTDPSMSNPILLQGTSKSVAMAYVPDNFRWWGGGGSSEERGPTTYIAGFFGSGVTPTNALCYDPAGNVSGGYTDSAHTVPLLWTPSLSSITSGPAGILSGGTLKSNGLCAGAANEFNSYLYLRSANVDQGDDSLNFKGPFEAQTNGFLSFSGTPITVGWNLLPGAQAAIDGIEVFYSTDPAYTGSNSNNTDNFPFSNHNNGFYCDQLLSNSFQSAGVSYSGNSLNLPAVITAATPVEVIACPFKKTGLLSRQLGGSFAYYQSGVAQSPNGGGGGGGALQNQLAFVSIATPPSVGAPVVPVLTQNTMSCTGYYLQAVDSHWTAIATPTTPTISLTMNGATGMAGFYPTAGCSGAINTVQLDANGRATVYMAMPSMMGNYSIMVNPPAGSGLFPSSLDFAFAQTSPPNTVIFSSQSQKNVVAGQCYEWDFEFMNGSYPTQTGAISYNPQITSGTGSFHLRPDCSDAPISGMTPVTSSTEHVVPLYFTTPSIGSGLVLFSTTSAAPSINVSFNAGDSTPALLNVFNQGGSGPCFPVGFEVENSVGARLNNYMTTYPFGLNASGLNLYIDPTCSGTAYNSLSGLTISNMSASPIYIKGTGNLSVSQVSSLGGGPYVLTMSPPPPPACGTMQMTSVMMDYSSGAFDLTDPCVARDIDLGGAGWQGITANSATGMGNYYWEYSVDTFAPAARLELSVASLGVAPVLDQSSGSPASGGATFVWNGSTGLCWTDGAFGGSCNVAVHQGDRLGYAITVNATNTQIWVSLNGSWIGGKTPGGSALMTLSVANTVVPAVLMTSPAGGPATKVTFITNPASFIFALPGGFNPLP